MKESNMCRIRLCPRCGLHYAASPALSRIDNKTLICPDCGTREALATIGISEEEQEEILLVMHRSIPQNNQP